MHSMVRRGEDEKKKSMLLISPYSIRTVSSTEKLNTEEKAIFYWLMTATDVKEYVI